MRRFLLAAGFAALGLALAGPSASAHALLSSSEPAANAALDRAPSRVSLTFTERPDPALSVVRVLDGSGRDVEEGSARPVPGADRSLSVALRPIERGVFTVTWRTTSAVDGHTTAGSFSFGVGVGPESSAATRTPAPSTPRPTPAGVAGRWLLYAGLSLLLGAAAMGLALGAGRWPRPPVVLAAGLAATGLVVTALDQHAVARVGMTAFLRSRTGHRLVLQAVAVVVAGVLSAAWSLRRSPPLLAATGVAGAAAMLARAAAGHAGASSVPWLTIGVQWAHLAAVGAWVGGLPFLLVALRRAEPGDRPAVAGRFSRLAVYGLLVVVATGTLRAVAEVGAWRRLTSTGYGQALLVKLVVVAILVALGAVSRFRHVRYAAVGLRRTIAAELAAGAVVLGVTAVLVGLAPPASIASARRAAPAPLVVSGHDAATAVRARLSVSPGTVGPNRFDLTLADFDTDRPLPATAVRLRFRFLDRSDVPESAITLQQVSAGRWTGAGAVLALDGRWRVTAAADTAAGGVEVPMTLEPKLAPQKVNVQRTPGLPTIYTVTDAAGRKAQIYLDPGRPGANELHVTGLDPSGAELRVTELQVTVRGPSETSPVALEARRLDPDGHFVADLTARRGAYDVRVIAALDGGAVLRARVRIPVG